MRTAVFMAALVTTVLWPSTGHAQEACPAASEQVEAYLEEKYQKQAPMSVLVYSHATDRWSAYERVIEKDVVTLNTVAVDKGLDLDLNGKPTLTTRHEKLVVLISDTNPMLYTLTPITATEVDIEDLQAIQQLASALGNVAVSFLGVRFQPGELMAQATRGIRTGVPSADQRLFIQRNSQLEASEYRDLIEEVRPDDDLLRQVEALSAEIKGEAERVTPPITAFAQTVKSLSSSLEKTELAASGARAYLQSLELGDVETKLLSEDANALAGQLESGFRAVQEKRAKLPPAIPCSSSLRLFNELLTLKFAPVSESPIERDTMIRRYRELVEKLNDNELNKSECNAGIATPLAGIRDRLAANPPGTGREPSASEALLLPSLRTTVILPYLEIETTVKFLGDRSVEILKKRGEVGKLTASFQVLFRRQQEHLRPQVAGKPQICSLISGVLESQRPNGTGLDLPWHKIRTEGFKLAIDPAYKEAVVPVRASDFEEKYDLRRRNNLRFGIDFGPVVTDVVSPVWEAVTDEDAVVDEGKEKPKRIALVDEESRSGKLAMFANFEPFHWRNDTLGLGFQVGAAIDDTPAVFAGATFGWGRFVRLGYGATWQEVKDLRGQEVGDIVADTASIKTRNTGDWGWYASLTISIDELPIFRPEEDEE